MEGRRGGRGEGGKQEEGKEEEEKKNGEKKSKKDADIKCLAKFFWLVLQDGVSQGS